jgi:uncharacterized protein YqhQ
MLRIGAKYYGVAFVRWIMTPGLWLQALTTREPDNGQVETAIAALDRVLAADGVTVKEPEFSTALAEPAS